MSSNNSSPSMRIAGRQNTFEAVVSTLTGGKHGDSSISLMNTLRPLIPRWTAVMVELELTSRRNAFLFYNAPSNPDTLVQWLMAPSGLGVLDPVYTTVGGYTLANIGLLPALFSFTPSYDVAANFTSGAVQCSRTSSVATRVGAGANDIQGTAISAQLAVAPNRSDLTISGLLGLVDQNSNHITGLDSILSKQAGFSVGSDQPILFSGNSVDSDGDGVITTTVGYTGVNGTSLVVAENSAQIPDLWTGPVHATIQATTAAVVNTLRSFVFDFVSVDPVTGNLAIVSVVLSVRSIIGMTGITTVRIPNPTNVGGPSSFISYFFGIRSIGPDTLSYTVTLRYPGPSPYNYGALSITLVDGYTGPMSVERVTNYMAVPTNRAALDYSGSYSLPALSHLRDAAKLALFAVFGTSSGIVFSGQAPVDRYLRSVTSPEKLLQLICCGVAGSHATQSLTNELEQLTEDDMLMMDDVGLTPIAQGAAVYAAAGSQRGARTRAWFRNLPSKLENVGYALKKAYNNPLLQAAFQVGMSRLGADSGRFSASDGRYSSSSAPGLGSSRTVPSHYGRFAAADPDGAEGDADERAQSAAQVPLPPTPCVSPTTEPRKEPHMPMLMASAVPDPDDNLELFEWLFPRDWHPPADDDYLLDVLDAWEETNLGRCNVHPGELSQWGGLEASDPEGDVVNRVITLESLLAELSKPARVRRPPAPTPVTSREINDAGQESLSVDEAKEKPKWCSADQPAPFKGEDFEPVNVQVVADYSTAVHPKTRLMVHKLRSQGMDAQSSLEACGCKSGGNSLEASSSQLMSVLGTFEDSDDDVAAPAGGEPEPSGDPMDFPEGHPDPDEVSGEYYIPEPQQVVQPATQVVVRPAGPPPFEPEDLKPAALDRYLKPFDAPTTAVDVRLPLGWHRELRAYMLAGFYPSFNATGLGPVATPDWSTDMAKPCRIYKQGDISAGKFPLVSKLDKFSGAIGTIVLTSMPIRRGKDSHSEQPNEAALANVMRTYSGAVPIGEVILFIDLNFDAIARDQIVTVITLMLKIARDASDTKVKEMYVTGWVDDTFEPGLITGRSLGLATWAAFRMMPYGPMLTGQITPSGHLMPVGKMSTKIAMTDNLLNGFLIYPFQSLSAASYENNAVLGDAADGVLTGYINTESRIFPITSLGEVSSIYACCYRKWWNQIPKQYFTASTAYHRFTKEVNSLAHLLRLYVNRKAALDNDEIEEEKIEVVEKELKALKDKILLLKTTTSNPSQGIVVPKKGKGNEAYRIAGMNQKFFSEQVRLIWATIDPGSLPSGRTVEGYGFGELQPDGRLKPGGTVYVLRKREGGLKSVGRSDWIMANVPDKYWKSVDYLDPEGGIFPGARIVAVKVQIRGEHVKTRKGGESGAKRPQALRPTGGRGFRDLDSLASMFGDEGEQNRLPPAPAEPAHRRRVEAQPKAEGPLAPPRPAMPAALPRGLKPAPPGVPAITKGAKSKALDPRATPFAEFEQDPDAYL